MKNVKNLVRYVFEMIVNLFGVSNKMKHSSSFIGRNRILAIKSTRMSISVDNLLQLEAFLREKMKFRFNVLTEEVEYLNDADEIGTFAAVGQRELNTFCLDARKSGIDCWDKDIARYVNSKSVEEYHPFRTFMNELPKWDGVDRLEALAGRVSDNRLWLNGFHRWMLALAAQWMGMESLHANSMAPIIVSRQQGKQKSTFCKILLPDVLQRYYTDSFDLSSQSVAEQKLGAFGLINLDEFDKFSSRKMTMLKNLMQMAGLNVRKAYKKSYSLLPRIASFIGTSNVKELLTDPTGSRRFLCVEIEKMIDCSPVDYTNIYAQLKDELLSGERYWFTTEEEAEIMKNNDKFYKAPIEEDVFGTCFRPTEEGEEGVLMAAADIFKQLKKKNPAAMSGVLAAHFGKILTSLGVEKIHTQHGNRYRIMSVN